MTPLLFADITIFVLSLLVGVEVISKVPATLHTPLMAGSNAIHGVVVVGVMVLAATVDTPLGYALRFPRIVRLRPDKPVAEIDTLDRVGQLYEAQQARAGG